MMSERVKVRRILQILALAAFVVAIDSVPKKRNEKGDSHQN
jgi:hypothetical protein